MFHPPLGNHDDLIQSMSRDTPEVRQIGQCVHRNSMDIERLLMITEALWTIVKEELKIDDEQLQRRIIEIDLRDDKYDGKSARKAGPKSCPKCARPISSRRPVCIYCGKQILPDPFAR